MAGRSPARFLAPLALVAFALALYLVIANATRDDAGGETTQGTAQPAKTQKTAQARKKKPVRRRYTVKSGDTPSGIAEKTGVSLDTILQLNPDLDPQSLSPGTKIRLRR